MNKKIKFSIGFMAFICFLLIIFISLNLTWIENKLTVNKISKVNSKEIALQQVIENNEFFKYLPNEFKNDKELALISVRINPLNLQYLSPDLRADLEIVSEAICRNGFALNYAAEFLRKDRNYILESVSKSGTLLKDLDFDLKNDEEIVIAAIMNDPTAIQYASQRIKDNPKFQEIAASSRIIRMFLDANAKKPDTKQKIGGDIDIESKKDN